MAKFVTQITSYSFTVISSYLIALNIEVELLGVLAFSKSLIGLFSILIPLSFASIYYQHNKDENFEDYFTIFFVYKSTLILTNFIPLYLMVFILEPELQPIFVILLTSNIISQFSEIFLTHLVSKMKILKASLPSFVFSLVHSLLRIFLALNVNLFEDPLIILTLLSLVFSSIGLLIALIASKGEYILKSFNWDLMKKYLKDSKPLILSNIFGVIVINLGKVLLSLSYGYETLAYFNLIDTNIITFLLVFSGSIKTLSLSLYSSLFYENKNKEIQRIANQLEKYYSAMFLFIIIFVFLNSELSFALFLPNYLPSVTYLYIMIFIPYFASINRPYSTQLVPGKKQKVSATLSLSKTSIKIILIILIVPVSLFSIPLLALGAVGLAVLESIFWLGDFFFYRYFSKKYFNISSYKRLYVQVFIAINSFIISFLIKQFILNRVIENQFILLLTSTGILLGLYSFELFFFKEIKKDDIKFFLSLLNIKSYKDSFLDEIRDNNNSKKN